MKLIIERAQRTAGMMSKKQVFSLTVKAEISQAERDAINKYKLADEVLYVDGETPEFDSGSMISALGAIAKSMRIGKLVVRDLVDGKTFENDDIGGMMATEEHIKTAATNLKAYLDTAVTFGGREVIEL